MNRIDQLIMKLCPYGVEHRELGDVGEIIRGKRFVKADMVHEGVPCIHYGEIYTKYGTYADESISFVTEPRARTLRFAQPGDVIMASAGETIEDIGKSVAWLGDEPIAIHDACYAFSSSMDPVFVAYFFASHNFRSQIRQKISSSKISSISIQNVAKARIPVPPLQVQQEIANILDTFRELEAELKAELEAELEARKQQYEHYKSEAFKFPENTPQIRLDSLVNLLQGYSFKSSSYVDSGIRVIRISDVQKGDISNKDVKYVPISEKQNFKRQMLSNGDLVMSLSGSVGRVAMLSENVLPAALNQRVVCLRPRVDTIRIRYLFHYLNTNDFENEAIQSTSGGTVKNLSARWLKAVQIPVPSLQDQDKLIAIFDKFDALVNDLSLGLSGEIVARRQQYEYYRDKLLTFEELDAAS